VPLIPPLAEKRAYHGSGENQSDGDIECRRRADQESREDEGKRQDEFCVMKNVVGDEQQESSGNDGQAAAERVNESELMAVMEAPRSQEKQKRGESDDKQRTPGKTPGEGRLRGSQRFFRICDHVC
jgi:hypothetical protein